MQREIMFHLGDPNYGIRSIKFVHLNYGRVEVSRKVGSVRNLVMGRVMGILIKWLFRRGRVLEMAHEVFFEVFNLGKIFLEDLNG
jgi:hypothetical protein